MKETLSIQYDEGPCKASQIAYADVGVTVTAGVKEETSESYIIASGMASSVGDTGGSHAIDTVNASYSHTTTTHAGTAIVGGAMGKYACSPCWKESKDDGD